MKRRWQILLAVVGLLVVLLALNTLVVNSETKSAEINVNEGRIVETSGGDVQVRENGPVDGPPIVLLHCYGCSLRWWDNLTPRLAESNRVISVDLIGFGGSEKPKSGYAIIEEASTVAAVLAELGVQDATVVGHSLGFDVATALAEQSPDLVARLVDIGEAPNEDEDYGEGRPLAAKASIKPVLGQAMWRLTPDFAIRDGVKDELFAPGYSLAAGFEDPDQVVEDFEAMTYTSFKETREGADDYVDEMPLDERLAGLDKPLLVIFGSDDQIYDAEPVLAAYSDIPGARTVEVVGAGHSPNVEKPTETANLILEFAAEPSDAELEGAPKKKGDGKKGDGKSDASKEGGQP